MTGAPCSDRTTVASLPKTFPAIERMGLAERPVFETETRGLDPVSNRSQCACLLARSGFAEGGGIEPLTFAVTLVFRTSRQPSSGAFHWSPCARPLSACEMPAGWSAAEPGFSCLTVEVLALQLAEFEPQQFRVPARPADR